MRVDHRTHPGGAQIFLRNPMPRVERGACEGPRQQVLGMVGGWGPVPLLGEGTGLAE